MVLPASLLIGPQRIESPPGLRAQAALRVAFDKGLEVAHGQRAVTTLTGQIGGQQVEMLQKPVVLQGFGEDLGPLELYLRLVEPLTEAQ